MDSSNTGRKRNKILNLLKTPAGKVVIGLGFAVIGFILTTINQYKLNIGAQKTLGTIFTTSQEITSEQIGIIVNALYPSFSWDSLTFSILFFFFGIVIPDLFSQPASKDTSVHYDVQDGVIEDLLHHLTEQVYNRCSHTSEKCAGCAKFASEGDALLRRYLYEESIHLQHSIKKSKEGQYVLDNDIPRFHTIAIDQLMGADGNQYSVIQWIGSTPHSSANLYDETYDSLDFDFLHALLSKVMSPLPNGKAYYNKTLEGGKYFKIK